MSSAIDLSLEEIIKKKKANSRNDRATTAKPNKVNAKQPAVMLSSKKLPIADARNKIISRKRNQITDAREKLAELAKQQDARTKLELLRQKRLAQTKGSLRAKAKGLQNKPENQRNKSFKVIREPVFSDPTRQIFPKNSMPANLRMQQKQNRNSRFTENRTFGSRRQFDAMKPITRTVANDLVCKDEDYPMEEDDISMSSKSSFLNHRAALNLKIVAHNNDIRKKIRGGVSSRLSHIDIEKSPPRPPSILKKRPMAALRTDKKTEQPAQDWLSTAAAIKEYRIIVSNLRSSVTAGDVQELFGDVGGMVESRLVRPGTAEVIYKTQQDAQKAVDLYHNRQLDGQPMNCLLVVPRVPHTPAARGGSTKSTRPASSNSNVEPDLSTFHKVLFSHL